MNWSDEQERALKAVGDWLDNPGERQVFKLFGYAGTGKTTLAKYLADQMSGRVFFCAYTGKAAHVMQQKGCVGATTIHKLIYTAQNKSKVKLVETEDELRKLIGELREAKSSDIEIDSNPQVVQLRTDIKGMTEDIVKPRFQLNWDSQAHHAALIVIDECSMVDGVIGEDLLSFKKPILVLGDPAQLPPVMGAGFFINGEPDFLLTEIHRQAEGNPIIELATRVRQGQELYLGQYGESSIIRRADLTGKIALNADQMIVGRNKTRNSFNRKFRKNLKMEGALPNVGDRLVCLRNNHELGLLNGSLWEVMEFIEETEDTIYMRVKGDAGNNVEVAAHKAIFLGQDVPWYEKTSAEEFDFGYALTCHKSQGSQWNKVLVFDESTCFRQNAQQWLYTAITRAAEQLVIVR